MKVLVADKFEQSGLDGLSRLGTEVLYEPTLSGDALAERLVSSEASILVVRSTKVTAETLSSSRLGLIVRAGAGVNTIDVKAASERGIIVTNCPGKNSLAVAELAFGLIIACDRRIPDNVADLRNGIWNKQEYSQSRGLYGRTLGLIGLGKIAQEMIVRAKAFGMIVVGHARWMTPDLAAGLGIGRADSEEQLAQMADVVSVHIALTPETRGSLGEAFFDKLRPGSIFVNTSRAEVVDEAALLRAVREKGIRTGLDVFEGEPQESHGTFDGPILHEPGVYGTHHIGASTEQAQEAIAAEVVRIVKEYRATGQPPNAVNVKSRAEVATHLLVVRHLDRVGVLAHVLSVLKDEGVNVQEMENIVLGGATTAIAQISVTAPPSEEGLLKIKLNPNVFDASVLNIPKVG
jgi:D-3-phosphoglycerate dehydrogenase / 2-oxoglutarate reductase